MLTLLDILRPFINKILLKLETLNNWKMARYTGYKAKRPGEDLVKITLMKVVTIQTDPNVFPMTPPTGGSGGRRLERGMLSPQRNMVPSGGTRSLALETLRHMRPSLPLLDGGAIFPNS
jgi:hypothetical protein